MWNRDLYARALDFAARAHGDQREPANGFPYVVHLCKVAAEVMQADSSDIDMDLAIACAVLHDTMEDAGIGRDALEAEFGASVALGVEALTKDATIALKADRMRDSLRRLEAQPRAVQMVKLADRITNLEPPPATWSPAKRRAYVEEAKLIHATLGSAHDGLADRLRERIARYEGWIDAMGSERDG